MVFLCSGDFSNLCDEGRFNAAVEALNEGGPENIRIFTEAISHLLQTSITNRDRREGRRIHRLARKCGLDSDPFLGTCLVRLYNFFDCLPEAKRAFRRIMEPNVFSWNAYISAYAKTGQFQQVLCIYHEMRSSRVQPNSYVIVSVLKACCREEDLMDVHSHAIISGLESEVFVGSTLIDMYVKCRRLEEALAVFHGMPTHNVVTWSTLIAGYVQQECPEAALHLFMQMEQQSLQPNAFTFVAMLKACATLGAVEEGRLIHNKVMEKGLDADIVVGSAIVDMYAKSGNLEEAHAMFGRMEKLDVVAWSALISGHAQHGQCQEALQLFWENLNKGMLPDNVALSTILQICSSVAAFEQGITTHMHVIECGLAGDLFVGRALVGMYAQCGSLEDACVVFEHLHRRSIMTWCTIISGCAQHNNFTLAVKYFDDMQQGGMKPNSTVFLALLSACNYAGLVEKGFYYFKLMREARDVIVMPEHFNVLVDLLGRMGCLDVAEDLLETLYFKSDVEGWTSLLKACHSRGIVSLGRRCFECLLSLGLTDSAYVMMSSIYAHACMHAEGEMIEEMRRAASLPRDVLTAFIETEKQVHVFTRGDLMHPRKEEIYSKLRDLGIDEQEANGSSGNSGLDICCSNKVKEYVSSSEETLCGHIEKLAVAFGLISSPPSTIIRVSKNLRMCAACHTAMKVVSKVEAREIFIFDGNRIHRFHDGVCCCKDLL
eukprot:c16874_g1_i1 orf=453-2597(+)